MFARQALTTARVASRLVARPTQSLAARRAAHTAHRPQAETHNPVTAFFRAVPMPVEAYPLAGLVVTMLGWATYHSVKHIKEDRDHLRWYPGAGGVKYVETGMTEMPLPGL